MKRRRLICQRVISWRKGHPEHRCYRVDRCISGFNVDDGSTVSHEVIGKAYSEDEKQRMLQEESKQPPEQKHKWK